MKIYILCVMSVKLCIVVQEEEVLDSNLCVS
jgi:hypothetical protein